MSDELIIDYCGEGYVVSPGEVFVVGRDGDLSVDEENPYLHRRVVEFRHDAGLWWLTNVGSRLSVTVSGDAGTLQAVVGPGTRIPVVLPTLAVLFAAGKTTYQVDVRCDLPVFEAIDPQTGSFGEATLGSVALTPSQFLLILALSEHALARVGAGASDLPTNQRAARRLGWPITTFNRKLDNVCDKFAAAGVRGLRGSVGQNAVNRRARLVEYAVAARIVRPEHLAMLDQGEQE